MYAYLTSVENFAYNWTREDFKWFDSFVIDPVHIFADFFVNFEMCEFNKIIDQIGGIASLDYAALADTMTRQILVIMIESPEAR